MKFGLYGLHKGENVPVLAQRARQAEDAGFESIWVGDHIALPTSAPDDPYQPRAEALVALAHIAAVTTRVKLGCGVIILPQRQPVLLAKQLTSIDVLSNGRLIVGLGVGYVEQELNAFGAALSVRAARTDEYVAAMKALWDEPTPAFEGEFVSFRDVLQRPRPVQRPHPPLVFGGATKASFRRARENGGYYGWGQTPDEVPSLPGLEISITPPGRIDAGLVEAYAQAGVDRLIVEPARATAAATDELIATIAALARPGDQG
jgi:probable F420-dependent oxidoreductase